MRNWKVVDLVKVALVHIVIALVLLFVGCGLLGQSGVSDNPALRAAFVEKGMELAQKEGMEVTEAELGTIYDNAVVIANSPAAVAISDVIEGNSDAVAKLKELLEEYLPKE